MIKARNKTALFESHFFSLQIFAYIPCMGLNAATSCSDYFEASQQIYQSLMVELYSFRIEAVAGLNKNGLTDDPVYLPKGSLAVVICNSTARLAIDDRANYPHSDYSFSMPGDGSPAQLHKINSNFNWRLAINPVLSPSISFAKAYSAPGVYDITTSIQGTTVVFNEAVTRVVEIVDSECWNREIEISVD